MPNLDDALKALRNADAAGNEADARRLAEIVDMLRKQEAAPSPLAAIPGTVVKGVNTGLANAVGGIVDLANLPLQGIEALTGLDVASDKPLGGSAMLREGLSSVNMGYESREDLPPQYRPLAAGGETFGQSIPFAVAPLAAVRAGITKAGPLTPVLETAARSPGKFVVTEAGLAAGAAQGRGIAEVVAPGNETVGLAGEVVGGFVNPMQGIRIAAGGVMNTLGRLRATVSTEGRKAAAGKAVKNAMVAAGEDPDMVLRSLEQPDEVSGVQYTAGQKAGSGTLLAIERKLIGESDKFDNETRRMMAETTKALNAAYREAVEAGDPAMLRAVAQERQRWFAALLDAKVASAQQHATAATDRIRPTNPNARQAANVRTREVLDSALGDARSVERDLWGQVPQDVDVPTESVLGARSTVREELLDEESLPAPVEAFLRRLEKRDEQIAKNEQLEMEGKFDQIVDVEPITSGELLRFRNRVLQLARNVRGQQSPDWSLHRHLMMLADGALDDLAEIGGAEEARAFSRALNDSFSRGEVGRLMGFERTGGVRTNAELTLENTVGRGGPSGAVASRDIENAAQAQNLPGVDARTTMPEQEQYLRDLASKTIDPTTGRVNPNQLDRWRRDNTALLQRFPELDRLTADASATQRALAGTEDVAKKAGRQARQEAAFARVAGFENPASAIAQALNGKEPITAYKAIARLARRGGADGVSGLRAATFDHLFNAATTRDGLVSGAKMRELLTARAPGQRSLLETMRAEGVLSGEQQRNLMKVINEVERLETALAAGNRIDEVFTGASPLEDLLTRVVGANIGGSGAIGQVSGAPLVAAQAGSRFARDIMQKLPVGRSRDVLIEALRNPRLMAQLLKKTKTPAAQTARDKQIMAFLVQAGLVGEGSLPSIGVTFPSMLTDKEYEQRYGKPRDQQ